MDEFASKQEKIQHLLSGNHIDALLLQRVSSFAWATCGASSATNSAETHGSASLLITNDHRYLITSTTEESRLAEEEGLLAQGWEFVTYPWYEPVPLEKLIGGMTVGADYNYPDAKDISVDMARLRTRMTLPEQTRMKQLGKDCAAAMNETMRSILPGMTEHKIASMLAGAVEKFGIRPVVNLVATDDRVFTYRHPLPTVKKMKKFVIVVLCGRRQGLVTNLTRFMHFGPIPEEIKRRSRIIAKIDAAFLSSTQPGRTLGEVFSVAQDAYKQQGYLNQWTILHQGGIAGYEPREFTAVPGSLEIIHAGQFFAWNPTLEGVKSEDTIFLGEYGIEIITAIDDWPMHEVNGVDDVVYQRPAILEL